MNLKCRLETTATTGIHLAAITGNTEVIQLMLNYGADLNACDANRSTALHKAVEYQNIEAVRLLLNAK